MSVQVIQDGKGKNAGVFIPYNQWRQLKKQHKELEALEQEEEPDKEQVSSNIKKGLKGSAAIQTGEIKNHIS